MTNQLPDNQRSIRFVVPALLLTCGAILLFMGVDTRPLRVWLQHAGPWAPLVFIVGGVAAMTVLVPKTAVSVTAGALFGSLYGSLLMLVTAVTAAALNYAIGRWWLHDSIDRKLRAFGQDAVQSSSQTQRPDFDVALLQARSASKWVSTGNFETGSVPGGKTGGPTRWRFEPVNPQSESVGKPVAATSKRPDWGLGIRAVRDLAREGGFRFHLLLRLAPIPTTLISYAMGASGSRLCPFLMAAAVAVVPQMLWVHGGTAAILINEPHTSPLRWAGVILSILAAIGVTVLVPLAIKRQQTRETSMEPNT